MGRQPKSDESPVDVAFRKIKEMMYRHELVPGQKLLYQELAGKLGMSITPVIQALNRLQLLGIVYSERNKGYYVGEADPVEATELITAREALETFLVPEVVRNLDEKKLRGIEAAMKEHGRALSAPQHRRFLQINDKNFHLKIVECAGNRVIYTCCAQIFERIYLKYRPEYMRDERLKKAGQEHQLIFEALKDRDEKRATRLIRQHIRRGKDHLVGSLWQDRALEL